MSALELKNINYKYNENAVLKNVSFSIEKGSFFVLLGLNGAGKSTIFSLLTRLLNLQDGNISINNYSIKDYQHALNSVGIVFQEPTLDLDLTVRQNLYYYGSLKGLSFKATLDSIKDELDNIGLTDKLDVITKNLNGGHRRRVEILRALINKPKLLLLDEPTVGLDVKSRFDILKYIRGLVNKKGISVLWITHLFDEIENTDSLAMIKDGSIIESSNVSDILKKYDKHSIDELFQFLSQKANK
ncbi:ATP-binding cassette domain-containing protein [Arcobacteraceae bacterium]|nr:ATP-binding cassette domain-containing protein [Arcobacteraceae bacterium]